MTTFTAIKLHGLPRPASSLPRLEWFAVSALAFLLVVCTYFQVAGSSSALLARLTLNAELTVGTWVSGMLLLTGAVLAGSAALRVKSHAWTGAVALGLLSMGLAVLCLDELASLHERYDAAEIAIPRALRLPPIGVAGLAGLIYIVTVLRGQRGRFGSAWLRVALGFGCLGTIYAQELAEHIVAWPAAWMPARVAIEEGTELVGLLLILSGVVVVRHRLGGEAPASSVGLNDGRVVKYLAWGLVAVAPLLILIQHQMSGNGAWAQAAPAGLAPQFILLALAAAYAFLFGRSRTDRRWVWWLLAASLLFTSLEVGARLRDLIGYLPVDRSRGDLSLLLIVPALVLIAWVRRSWSWGLLAGLTLGGVALNLLVFKTPLAQAFGAAVPFAVIGLLAHAQEREAEASGSTVKLPDVSLSQAA